MCGENARDKPAYPRDRGEGAKDEVGSAEAFREGGKNSGQGDEAEDDIETGVVHSQRQGVAPLMGSCFLHRPIVPFFSG